MQRIAIIGPLTIAPLLHLLDSNSVQRANDYPDLGLGGSQITQLVEELVRCGYTVLACSTERKIRHPVLLRGPLLSLLFVPYQKPFKRLLTIYRSERRTIAAAIREFSPDIVHAHWTYEFALAAIDTKLRHLITVRDHPLQVIREMNDKPYRVYRLLLHCLVIYRGKAFSANSPVTAKVVPKKKLKAIIPNGINIKYSQHSFADENHREEITVCSIGSGDKSKNIKAVIDAVTQIANKGYSIRLRVLGPGLSPRSPLHDYVKSIGATSIILMMGVVSHEEAMRLIASSHLYIHPSKLESFGNPVVEAMLVGTPCLVPKVGQGPEWILDNGQYGIVANGADAKDLERAIACFLSDPLPANLKARLAKQHAQKELSITNVTDKYLQLYEQISTSK